MRCSTACGVQPYLLRSFHLTVQALTEPALSVKLLRPDTLRRALLSAGNIVKPDEVSDVLSYVTSDKRFENLDGLHLILLHDGTVQQMKWDSTGGMKYFIFTDDTSQGIYDLMEGSKHQLVEGSPAWKKLSK